MVLNTDLIPRHHLSDPMAVDKHPLTYFITAKGWHINPTAIAKHLTNLKAIKNNCNVPIPPHNTEDQLSMRSIVRDAYEQVLQNTSNPNYGLLHSYHTV